MIQWEAINEARASGYRYFDFGEVPEGHDELAKFKSKWGAEPVRMHRYYYPGIPRPAGGPRESRSYADSLTNALWPRLPLAVASWLGDKIYSYL